MDQAHIPSSAAERDLVAAAKRVMPAGGTGNSSHDIVMRSGQGGRLTDESGETYVDLLLGSGPMLVGHAHPHVTAAVQEQIARGTTFFVNNAAAIKLAEIIVDAVACADKVRYTSSGTEATHYCLRVARAYRKRDKILKFEGGFHGMGEYALMSVTPRRPGNFPQATADTPGIPQSVTGEMLIAPFNDADAATALIAEHADELAGVIMEPCQRLLPPRPGFLEAVRKATADKGIPLIFDEIVTGFRFAWGGAQEYYGVVPDLCALGKVIGGGFPLAAIAGREEIMAHFDKGKVGDAGFTQQTGTLSGNPVAAVAGVATLEVMREPGMYERLFKTGNAVKDGFTRILKGARLPAQVLGEAPMFDIVFADGDLKDYRAIARGDGEMLKRFNRAMLARGVLKADSKCYISTAHDDADVAKVLEAAEGSIKAIVDGTA